ncbi:MAG: M48 family metallopeptidase [Pseudomonadales bacterium]|jgi:predicted metal-dependent hydrolase|nr:M48 family metallopeptidase [Pseudomonadales bacterium]
MPQSTIDYILKRSSRSSNIRISINKDGEVVVSAPKLIPKFIIDKFVLQQHDWIKKNQSKIVNKSKIGDNHLQLFGKKYPLIFTYQENLPLGLSIHNNQAILNDTHYLLKPKQEGTKLTKVEQTKIEQLLKNTAEKYIIPRTHQLIEKMTPPKKVKHISLRNQSSRWGSCSSLGNLNFNYRLVHFAPNVIDYVIIHEIAHLTHMNHSSKFWALVAKYDGNYKLHRQILKNS